MLESNDNVDVEANETHKRVYLRGCGYEEIRVAIGGKTFTLLASSLQRFVTMTCQLFVIFEKNFVLVLLLY